MVARVRAGRWLSVLLGLVACARGVASTAPAQPVDASTVTWSQVRAELDVLVCIASFPDEQGGTYEVPVHGVREDCKLPRPANALARATTEAFTAANVVIRAYSDESRASQEAMRTSSDPAARLAAVRAAFFTERVLAVLQRRLDDALAKHKLRCIDCPQPAAMQPRVITWSELAPYLAAHVWPARVVTPRGPDGKPTGETTYSLHMCVGINGIDRMTHVDEDLRFAALLAAFDTEVFFERTPLVFAAIRDSPEGVAITDDAAKTEYLRARVGPAVAADPAVRAGICATLARFVDDTPIRVTDCDR